MHSAFLPSASIAHPAHLAIPPSSSPNITTQPTQLCHLAHPATPPGPSPNNATLVGGGLLRLGGQTQKGCSWCCQVACGVGWGHVAVLGGIWRWRTAQALPDGTWRRRMARGGGGWHVVVVGGIWHWWVVGFSGWVDKPKRVAPGVARWHVVLVGG